MMPLVPIVLSSSLRQLSLPVVPKRIAPWFPPQEQLLTATVGSAAVVATIVPTVPSALWLSYGGSCRVMPVIPLCVGKLVRWHPCPNRCCRPIVVVIALPSLSSFCPPLSLFSISRRWRRHLIHILIWLLTSVRSGSWQSSSSGHSFQSSYGPYPRRLSAHLPSSDS